MHSFVCLALFFPPLSSPPCVHIENTTKWCIYLCASLEGFNPTRRLLTGGLGLNWPNKGAKLCTLHHTATIQVPYRYHRYHTAMHRYTSMHTCAMCTAMPYVYVKLCTGMHIAVQYILKFPIY